MLMLGSPSWTILELFVNSNIWKHQAQHHSDATPFIHMTIHERCDERTIIAAGMKYK